jgi:hypothetical protein
MAGLSSARMGTRLAAAFGAVVLLLVAVVAVALAGLRSEARRSSGWRTTSTPPSWSCS